MAERRVGARLAAALLGTVALAGCASTEIPEEGLVGSEVDPAWPVPDTVLRDTAGSSYSLSADTDKPVTLVFFGYTNCPEICSMVMANVTQALTRVGGAAEQVDVVFVTTDPGRDDEQVLTRYLSAFDEDYIGLTGEMAAIRKVGEAFHIAFEKGERLPSGGYDVLHNDHVFVVDSEDTIPLFWRRTTSPAEMAHDLDQLIPEE